MKEFHLIFKKKMRKRELPKLGKLPDYVELVWRKGHVVALKIVTGSEKRLKRWETKLLYLENLKITVKKENENGEV